MVEHNERDGDNVEDVEEEWVKEVKHSGVSQEERDDLVDHPKHEGAREDDLSDFDLLNFLVNDARVPLVNGVE